MVRLSDQTFCVLNQDFGSFKYVSEPVLEIISSKILGLLDGTYFAGVQVTFLLVFVQQLF